MFERESVKPRIHSEIVIEIPGRPPNTNDANRQTPQQKWRIRRDWRNTANTYAVHACEDWRARHGAKWEPLKVAEVDVTFVLPDARRRDLDNLVSTLKPLIDGAVDAGVIVDDSVQCLNALYVSFRIARGKIATILTFREPIE